MYNFFISYCDEEYDIVSPIVDAIRYNKCCYDIKCWFQREDSKGDFRESIIKGIRESDFFLCFVSHKSIKSIEVKNEIELALKKLKKDNKNDISYIMLPIIIDDLDEDEEVEIVARFGSNNWVYEKQFKDIDSFVLTIFSKLNIQPEESNITSAYTGNEQIEIERIKKQNDYLNRISSPFLDTIFSNYVMPSVLDIGCADGHNTKLRMEGREYRYLLGVDKNEEKIKLSKLSYTSNKDEFLTCDIESDYFDIVLTQYLQEKKIKGFDIIHIAAVLMHTKNPGNLIKKIYTYLLPGGTIFIQDEDDGFNVSYPKNKFIESCNYIWKHSIESGDRSMGRKIPKLLTDSGFINIHLLSSTVSSLDFNGETKEILWDIYYNSDFWVTDSQLFFDTTDAYDTYKKYKEHHAKLKEQYLRGDFFITLGILFFSAQKPSPKTLPRSGTPDGSVGKNIEY